jgi:hypothetical protein
MFTLLQWIGIGVLEYNWAQNTAIRCLSYWIECSLKLTECSLQLTECSVNLTECSLKLTESSLKLCAVDAVGRHGCARAIGPEVPRSDEGTSAVECYL